MCVVTAQQAAARADITGSVGDGEQGGQVTGQRCGGVAGVRTAAAQHGERGNGNQQKRAGEVAVLQIDGKIDSQHQQTPERGRRESRY